jgi:hypothetical protein
MTEMRSMGYNMWLAALNEIKRRQIQLIPMYEWTQTRYEREEPVYYLDYSGMRDDMANLHWRAPVCRFAKSRDNVSMVDIYLTNDDTHPSVSVNMYAYSHGVDTCVQQIKVRSHELDIIRSELVGLMSPRDRMVYENMLTVQGHKGPFTLYANGIKVFTGNNQFKLCEVMSTSSENWFKVELVRI